MSGQNADKTTRGKPLRRQLAAALAAEAVALNLTHRVLMNMVGVRSEGTTRLNARRGAEMASRSTFCLCPSGDIVGFTARFYFSIIHGCIPVYVDMFPRALTFDDLLFPFPTSIDWGRVTIFRTLATSSGLLQHLSSLPATEVAARQRYIRSIASLLVYDTPGVERDAPAAFIEELEHRFLGDAGRRGKQARRGAGGELLCDLANRTVGSPRCHHAT